MSGSSVHPSETAPLRKLGTEELRSMLEQHRRWAESDCHDGTCAELAGTDLSGLDLSGTDLRGAILTGACLIGTRLTGAKLNYAHLSRADLSRSDLTDARMIEVNLSEAILRVANLSRVDLHAANLTHADLRKANFCDADLRKADLSGAIQTEVNFTGADLRESRGLILDAALVRHAQITPISNALWSALCRHVFTHWKVTARWFPPRHNDPWSVLRQTYAGPRVAFLLLGLIAFAIPYLARGLFWSTVSRIESPVLEKAHQLGEASEKPAAGATRWVADHFERRPLWMVLLKLDQGILPAVLAAVLIAYNVCVFLLVYCVGPLRDQEERSGRAPGLSAYGWLSRLHQIASILLYVSLVSFVWNVSEMLSSPVWVPTRGG